MHHGWGNLFGKRQSAKSHTAAFDNMFVGTCFFLRKPDAFHVSHIKIFWGKGIVSNEMNNFCGSKNDF